jgi:MFS family permease
VLAGFAALGAFWGAWGAVLPAVQDGAHASDAELGLALLLVGLGALGSMRATGALIDRLGSRTTAATVAALGLAAFLPGLANQPAQLALALFVLGAASGAMDVAINAEGVLEEETSGRPVLNLAHAAFSGAVVASSLIAAGLRAAGAGAEPVLLAAGAVVLTVAAGLARGRGWAVSPQTKERGDGLGLPAWLLLLGALCALAYWVENAWQSWGAVHLEDDLGASAGVSALAPAAFASAAMVGRLAGQRLLVRFGDRRLVAAGATVAAAGTLLAATADSVPTGLAGIVLAGFGTSVCAPTIISLAGAAAPPEYRGAAVSTVTTIAYLGFLVGPAAVGGVAGLADLPASLTVVAGLAAALALLVAVVPLPRRRAALSAAR